MITGAPAYRPPPYGSVNDAVLAMGPSLTGLAPARPQAVFPGMTGRRAARNAGHDNSLRDGGAGLRVRLAGVPGG
ncbi:hypothetical protein GCM10022224_007090 [Nonomuraea antimicrobica]|uniref:Uncharacterized protein n=1 Tax=Nonomuraea antimicrobica TaxID=561173 RepID=A0ABP7B3B0_9ACTN